MFNDYIYSGMTNTIDFYTFQESLGYVASIQYYGRSIIPEVVVSSST